MTVCFGAMEYCFESEVMVVAPATVSSGEARRATFNRPVNGSVPVLVILMVSMALRVARGCVEAGSFLNVSVSDRDTLGGRTSNGGC